MTIIECSNLSEIGEIYVVNFTKFIPESSVPFCGTNISMNMAAGLFAVASFDICLTQELPEFVWW